MHINNLPELMKLLSFIFCLVLKIFLASHVTIKQDKKELRIISHVYGRKGPFGGKLVPTLIKSLPSFSRQLGAFFWNRRVRVGPVGAAAVITWWILLSASGLTPSWSAQKASRGGADWVTSLNLHSYEMYIVSYKGSYRLYVFKMYNKLRVLIRHPFKKENYVWFKMQI